MKEHELRSLAVCGHCKKKIGHTGLLSFWVVTLQRFGLDHRALQRQTGMELLMGGHVALAQVMGPNEDLAKPLSQAVTISVCERCATEEIVLACLDAATEEAPDADHAKEPRDDA